MMNRQGGLAANRNKGQPTQNHMLPKTTPIIFPFSQAKISAGETTVPHFSVGLLRIKEKVSAASAAGKIKVVHACECVAVWRIRGGVRRGRAFGIDVSRAAAARLIFNAAHVFATRFRTHTAGSLLPFALALAPPPSRRFACARDL